ncbi:MAG: SRPBCC domain-containing protein [Candidatus Nanopelagicales bacterium]
MTVVSVEKDLQQLQLTLIADFDAPPERVWQVWQDARKLERWWGPPTWPATFTHHELVVGGTSKYFMTGPDGTKAPGWLRTTSVNAPTSLTFDEGFADSEGNPVDLEDKTSFAVSLVPSENGTRMTVVSTFLSAEQMEKLVTMGMVEGFTEALGQIDEVLAAD